LSGEVSAEIRGGVSAVLWDMTRQAGRGGGKSAGVRRREVVVSSGNGVAEVTARQAARASRAGSGHVAGPCGTAPVSEVEGWWCGVPQQVCGRARGRGRGVSRRKEKGGGK
jgi:hypothetical protein